MFGYGWPDKKQIKRRLFMEIIVEKNRYTYEDYMKLPEDARYELIEGELVMSPSPITRHQKILRFFIF